jgi:hypothetical protein
MPDWEIYKTTLLDLNSNNNNFEKILGSDEEKNFMKFISAKIIKKELSNLNNYFNNINIPIKFIVLFGTPPNTELLDGIHKDGYPMEGYNAGDYAINFSISNSEDSFIVFFDELENEICRRNYSNSPLLFRTDVFHSVLNFSDNIRITASLRFDKSLEARFKEITDE